MYRNDKAPEYYTTFDDHTLIFDSFDVAVENTLQKTKTLAYGKKDQTWTEEDDFVPFIDKEMAILLLNEAKGLAFLELKQVGHPRAEQTGHRLWVANQKKKRSVDSNRDELSRAPNFGRK
jgi:hypothetical protein